MNLSIGIIGLPNVGKSTLFNALARSQQAPAENYPFCTIDANHAIVPLPDDRLTSLQSWTRAPQAIPARVDFVDVAGLVKGASQGEGLGNRFLGHIRDVKAIVHVVRCFNDPNVVRVQANTNPADDIATVNTELALADLQQLQRRQQSLEREVKGNRDLSPLLNMAQRLEAHLDAGYPLRKFPERGHPAFAALNQDLRLLTAKPVIYLANIDEDSLREDSQHLQSLRQIANAEEAECIAVCASLEQELADLNDDERGEYLSLYGLQASSLERLIRACCRLLGLISFFTFNENEARAWTIPRGWTAPQAAGIIHSDFERGFIRAEVIPFPVFADHQDRALIKAAGLIAVEGRDYIVQDGDVILFRFNV